ncbi:MAG: tetratricopeptide repeat protein [Methylotenera sp.]|nr:tetratricopeptide repeat protein [Methylotenera sp.]
MPLNNKQINNKKIISALFFVVLAVYSNPLYWGAFQFDDYNIIVNNPVVHSWQAWWADVGHGIRPLLKLSYTFDWILGGWALDRREAGFHFTNLLIHSGNTVLVWFLTVGFLRQSNRLVFSNLLANTPLIGAVTALLFAVHPIHTEAVTYISGRSASLMTLFYLGGILCYMTGLQKQSRFYLHVATPILFIAALAVKEVAITFPLALLLIHTANGDNWRASITYAWSSWLVFITAVIFFLLDANYSQHLARSFAAHDGWSNLAVQANAVLYLLGQWFCPLRLNIDPDLSVFSTISKSKLGLIFAIFIAFLGLSKKINQRPWLSFALSWVVIHLFLVYLITPRLDIANERQLYLISWPLLMALVAELTIFLNSKQFIMVTVALFVIACTLTIVRNQDYRSEVALWQATVKLSPNKSRVHNNLGYAYFLAGQPDKARQHYLEALALDNQNFKARYNLKALDLCCLHHKLQVAPK